MKFCDTAKCSSKQSYQFILPPAVYESAHFYLSLPALAIINLFNFCQSDGWKYNLIVLVCIFLITSEVEQLFICSLPFVFHVWWIALSFLMFSYLAICFFILIHEPNVLSFLSLPTYLCLLLILMLILYIFPMHVYGRAVTKKYLIDFHCKSKNTKTFHSFLAPFI